MLEVCYPIKGKHVLVTGGGGFIGGNVVKKLLEAGAVVTSLYYSRKPKEILTGVTYLQADLTKKDECIRVCADIDCVVMTAAYVTGAKGVVETPMKFVTDTVTINMYMLEAAYACNIKKCIYISSTIVYPFSREPLTEEMGMVGEPFEKYYFAGWTRRFSEIVCRMYAERLPKHKMDITVLRIDNIYGPGDNFGQDRSHVIPALIRKAIERMDPFEVWGDGNDYKDFIYVEDLAVGIISAIERTQGFDIYNLASGNNLSINDALKVILKCADYSDANIVHNLAQPTMIPFKMVSIEKSRSLLGFNPRTSFEEGVAKTIEWYKNNLDKIN